MNTEIQECRNTRIQIYVKHNAAGLDNQKCVDQVESTSIRDPIRLTDEGLTSMEIWTSGNMGIRKYGNTEIRKCATYSVKGNSLLQD